MANCVVPTSMLIIGCLLSGSPLIDVLKKPILYLITLLRCLVMPLIAAVILRFTGWNRTVCLCIVMVLGCSVATVISIFGVRYDRSPEMASKSVLQSNLLLPVTMPLMMVHRRTDLIRRDDYGLLFTPAKLGTCELKNRIVRSATNGHLSDEKGQVTPL